MEIANNERMLVRAIKEIAEELNLKLYAFSQAWVMRLERGDQVSHIFGYNFDLNGASAQLITNDKSASAELLSYNNIRAVEHRLFLRPNLAGYVAGEGNWREMLCYFESNGADMVCKSNTGTGGNQVFRAQTPLELESAVHQLFYSNRALALSPFIEINSEYRLIMLGNGCELAYEKVRPSVSGDGRSTILELISRDYSANDQGQRLIASLSKEGVGFLSSVPREDERVRLCWKHNLGQGAMAVEINEERLKSSLSEIAVSCMKALNLNFASVDIIESDKGLSVMEINSGVMMESYARQGEKEYEKAKGIYRNAVLRMLP